MPFASPGKRLKTPEKASAAVYISLSSPDPPEGHSAAQHRSSAVPEDNEARPLDGRTQQRARSGLQRLAGRTLEDCLSPVHGRPAGSSAAGAQTGQGGSSSQGQAMQPQQVLQRRHARTKPAHAAGKALGKAHAQVLPVCHLHGCTVTCVAASCPALMRLQFPDASHSAFLQLASMSDQGVPDLTGGPAASQRSSHPYEWHMHSICSWQ